MPRLLLAAALLLSGSALVHAQSTTEPSLSAPEPHTKPAHTEEEEEPAATLALGGSTGWLFSGGAAAFGSDTSVEFTVIPHRLVLEPGAVSLFTHTSTEWDIDCLFKKPWSLSPTIEAMAGLGPEYANLRSHGRYTNTVNAELIGDFLFWASRRHRFGFYAEPAYAIDLRQDHAQSIGLTAGLLIGIPHRTHTHDTHDTPTP